MADKGKLEIETLEPIKSKDDFKSEGIVIDDASSGGKPTAKHLEVAKGKPYWDSPYVIGASRNVPPAGSFTSQDKVTLRRPNVIVRLWRHYKRHWKLYGILTIIFLAIFLPLA